MIKSACIREGQGKATHRTGRGSLNHLSRWFKKQAGVPPVLKEKGVQVVYAASTADKVVREMGRKGVTFTDASPLWNLNGVVVDLVATNGGAFQAIKCTIGNEDKIVVFVNSNPCAPAVQVSCAQRKTGFMGLPLNVQASASVDGSRGI